MSVPTKEEYEAALTDKEHAVDVVVIEEKRRDRIIKDLCGSQELIEKYRAIYYKAKDVIEKYEAYERMSKLAAEGRNNVRNE